MSIDPTAAAAAFASLVTAGGVYLNGKRAAKTAAAVAKTAEAVDRSAVDYKRSEMTWLQMQSVIDRMEQEIAGLIVKGTRDDVTITGLRQQIGALTMQAAIAQSRIFELESTHNQDAARLAAQSVEIAQLRAEVAALRDENRHLLSAADLASALPTADPHPV